MKRCIYVVDDQSPVMETAVLILRSSDRQWEVRGFTDPLEALAAVKSAVPDLILSDQLMPGMLGSQLLEEVRGISGATIRVIMSGYVPLNKLALVTSAHQFISKPFDTSKLRDTIKRSFAAQERITDKTLQAIVTSLRSIPSLPQAHQALLKELEDESSASTNIARLVADDAGLSVKVLQLANSPLFGQGYTVTSPIDAVMCLGTELISAVVLAQSLFRHYEKVSQANINLAHVWAHCWEAASLAQHICQEMRFSRKTSDEAFLAGLLHETGRFILVDNFPEKFQSACQRARQTGTPLGPHLKDAFGANPCEITAYVLELWGMPTTVIDAVAAQSSIGANGPGAEGAEFTLATALYVANGLAAKKCPPDPFGADELNAEYLKAVGCSEKIADWEKMSFEGQ